MRGLVDNIIMHAGTLMWIFRRGAKGFYSVFANGYGKDCRGLFETQQRTQE